jgi:DNA-binding NarL/FixJ family response regulator
MKTINVTYISPGESALQHCAELVLQHRDIDVVAVPAGLTQQGAWRAFSIADVVIIDEAAIRCAGFEAVNMLLVSHPEVNCLIVMEEEDHASMVWALTQGVRGVLVQAEVDSFLAKAIRRVNAGEIWISRRLTGQLRDRLLRFPKPGTSHAEGSPARGWARWH